MIVLEDKAYVWVSVIAEIIFVEGWKIVAIYYYLTARDIVKTANEVKESGFSASAFSEDKYQSGVGQGKVDIVQRLAGLTFFCPYELFRHEMASMCL